MDGDSGTAAGSAEVADSARVMFSSLCPIAVHYPAHVPPFPKNSIVSFHPAHVPPFPKNSSFLFTQTSPLRSPVHSVLEEAPGLALGNLAFGNCVQVANGAILKEGGTVTANVAESAVERSAKVTRTAAGLVAGWLLVEAEKVIRLHFL